MINYELKKLGVFSITLLLIFVFIAGCNTKTKNNEYAENFDFTLLNGEKKSMSDYQGKIVLLDFMGAYCVPCQYMMFVLYDIHSNYPDVEIVSIDVWAVMGETIQTVQSFLSEYEANEYPLSWTFGIDDDYTLYEKYTGTTGVPRILILDKNGNIYYSTSGYTDYTTEYNKLSSKLDELID